MPPKKGGGEGRLCPQRQQHQQRQKQQRNRPPKTQCLQMNKDQLV